LIFIFYNITCYVVVGVCVGVTVGVGVGVGGMKGISKV
jgi:hypothetical protein